MEMNQFEALCKLASDENGCWKLGCSTCGHFHFRYAFLELATGKSPKDSNWIVNFRDAKYCDSLGDIPTSFTEEQKRTINNICADSNIKAIAESCRFPDWLGYVGLVIEYTRSSTESYKKLSKSLAFQLSEMISKESKVYERFSKIATGQGLLNIRDLEEFETEWQRK